MTGAGTRTAGRAAVLVMVSLLAGCGQNAPPEPPTPEGTALDLFRLAALPDRQDEQLHATFELPEDEARLAALHDALDLLSAAIDPRVERIEPLEGLDRVVVDLRAGLPAGGEASYSSQLESTADGRWVVRWFCGPGIEWPPHRRPEGQGLTTSSGPGEPG